MSPLVAADPPPLQTARLRLRCLTPSDAGFIQTLVNDADWLRYIGDKQVRTLDDAVAYIENGPRSSYRLYGHGLYAVEQRDGGAPIGLCGLIRRDTLPAPDIGFALLPAYRNQGYVTEAAAAVIAEGRQRHGLTRLLAIVSPGNEPSIAVIGKLGLAFERVIQLGSDPRPTLLYSRDYAVGAD